MEVAFFGAAAAAARRCARLPPVAVAHCCWGAGAGFGAGFGFGAYVD